MSIRTRRWIECELCSAEYAGDPDSYGGEAGADIRVRARADGWRRPRSRHGALLLVDLCPDHPDAR